MLTFDAYAKAVAAIVSAALALLLLVPSKRESRILAIFLSLIAMNQGAEVARALLQAPADVALAFRIASIAASLDPFVLGYFAMSFRPTSGRSTLTLLALGIPAALLCLYAAWSLQPPESGGAYYFGLALGVYTAAVYGWATLAVIGSKTESATATSILSSAMLLAAVPAGARAAEAIANSVLVQQGIRLDLAVAIVPYVLLHSMTLLGAIGFAAIFLRASRRSGSQLKIDLALAGGIMIVLFSEIPNGVAVLARAAAVTDLAPIGRAEAAIRWLGFGALASIYAFGQTHAAVRLSHRRTAARVLIGLAAVVLVLILAATILPFLDHSQNLWFESALVLIVVALSQGFRRGVDRVAQRLYGVPLPGDIAAAHDLYRNGVAAAFAEGRQPSRDARLQEMRESLHLGVAEAEAIERLVEDALPQPLAVGNMVRGRYRVEALLAQGLGRTIALCDDTHLRRRVVLKEIPIQEQGDGESLREAQTASALDHENIVRVYDLFRRGASWLLVQEYVTGGTLDECLRGSRAWSSPRDRIALGILRGAAAVHEGGIVHGDIKPANILLTPDGQPKLADFGLARFRTQATVGLKEGETLVGTPEFMAPEQRRGRPGGMRTDVYALGLVLQRLLSEARLSSGQREVIQRACATDPADRWPDARSLMNAWASAALFPEQQ